MKESLGTKIKRNTHAIGVSGLTLLVAAGFVYSWKTDMKRADERKQRAAIVDINHDGYASPEEWGGVYRRFGLTYDPPRSDPGRDITKAMLETYRKETLHVEAPVSSR